MGKARTILLLAAVAAMAGAATAQLAWWQSGVVYQIYPKSFKDSDGDGVGDINGVIEKLDYLKSLGIAAIWLSPIFKSPMADNGYDISDFRDIDPTFGTMADFEALLEAAHERGIKVVLDFVPNHSSDEHEWFIASSDPTHENYEKYKDYYVWVDAKEDGSVPNNWPNQFDQQTAWEWNDARQQYYLHQFHIKQPDLNYRNPEVLAEMEDVLRFWLDKGVDGYRMDAVPHMVEKAGFPDEIPGDPDQPYKHQPETYVIIQEFRSVVDEYDDRTMMTEAYGTVDQIMGYYGNATNPGADFSFNFVLITDLNAESTAEDFVEIIGNWIDVVNQREVWSNWVIGNHDQHRVASRYSPELVDGMNMLVTLLPGTAVTYNGEEIGMEDNYNMTCEVAHDPQGCLDGVTLGNSRDPERTPFQWDDTKNAGFSTGDSTWLPVNENYVTLNAAAQEQADRSHLKTYRQLVALRQESAVQTGASAVKSSGTVFAFSRTATDGTEVAVAVNLSTEPASVDLVSVLGLSSSSFVVSASSISSPLLQGSAVDASSLTLSGHESVTIITAPAKIRRK
ncbi:maltase 2-like [Schistocerca piceifrons]|uniref:maltase 2-like n=1 Tax=Schistocerca piceifrons TaxID=274613 RepID=UPI001F5EAD8F|nr:maltase 2-like [Schistocerca piceifrons]